MRYLTHLLFSIYIALILADYISIENNLLFFLSIALFSSFPDIDEPRSKFSKKIKPLSFLINLFFGHRNLFHSLTLILPLFIMIFILFPTLALAFLIASLSHLFLDSLTPKGVFPFYPLKYRLKGFIKTGSILEKLLLVIILALIIIKLL